MTIEEAIEIIKAYRAKLTNSPSNHLDGDIKAFDMAIRSLEAWQKVRGEVTHLKADVEEKWGHQISFDRISTYEECLDIIDRHLKEI